MIIIMYLNIPIIRVSADQLLVFIDRRLKSIMKRALNR